MAKRTAFIVAAVVASVGFSLNAAAENFQKLSGAQIRAKLTGMQFTDEVHWGEAYWPDGKLTSDAMGRKRVGRWGVTKDQLCTDYGKDSSETACYEVWISGRNMQLRMPDCASLPFEGVLERAPTAGQRTRSSKSRGDIPVTKSRSKYQTPGGSSATQKIESHLEP